MLITLSGIDCSGKSTQLERLVAALEARGRRVSTFWFRPGYSPEMDAIRGLIRRARPSAIPGPGHSAERSRTFQRPAVARSWMAMATVDTLLQYGVKLRALLAAGRVVVCDRYLHDARLDLKLRFPEQYASFGLALDTVEWVCPRPDVAILLTIPRDEMLRRMALKAEPFPDPPDLRDRRHQAYLRLAEVGPVEAVAADQPIDAIHGEIMAHVDRRSRR